jgi:hypothetical protein
VTNRRRPQATVPRDLAIARMRGWQTVRAGAVEALARSLKAARLATERKQRQVHAVCTQPGQEAMAESTIARAEKVQALSKTGDIGLFKVSYLALLYNLNPAIVVRRMFAPLIRHAEALDELETRSAILSDERMARLVELARHLSDEQLTEDEELGAGEWVETAHVWLDELHTWRDGEPGEGGSLAAGHH